ncbi:MAG: putative DNA binding domain-containing protein [Firmicutes bacterium]|nr:putative DNA binding domain-containing protein [Bacillota bacterium]
MFDSKLELMEKIRTGEDSFIEFKEIRVKDGRVVDPNTESIAGEICAFANSEGGVLLFGVSDAGIIAGISEEDIGKVEGWVTNICQHNCVPPVRPVISKLLLPDVKGVDKRVLKLDIIKSLFVHATSGGVYYHRIGSSKQGMTPPELARLFQQRRQGVIFDEQPVREAGAHDLDLELLRPFLRESPLERNQLLSNLSILTRVDDSLCPTAGGLLNFSREPQKYLPSAYIEAAVYKGTRLDSNELVHGEKIMGPLSAQIDGAVTFVDRFMLRPARKEAGREDFPQLSMKAVHEAIVNAVAHRDYSIYGSKIRLFLFRDRLEVYSPGRLPNTITLENIMDRQFSRNQLIVSFLSKMKSPKTGRAYIEARGEGVRLIFEESLRLAGKEPVYKLPGEELLLIIWAAEPPVE